MTKNWVDSHCHLADQRLSSLQETWIQQAQEEGIEFFLQGGVGPEDWELQRKLDVLAPARIEVPTCSMIKVQYSQDGGSPVMEVRLQELFGLLDTPTANEGRNKILLHLLSPGYKPVQVTQDLKSFWKNTYHEVRSELRRRYPRHSWPEDPLTAVPVRGAKKRNTNLS